MQEELLPYHNYKHIYINLFIKIFIKSADYFFFKEHFLQMFMHSIGGGKSNNGMCKSLYTFLFVRSLELLNLLGFS